MALSRTERLRIGFGKFDEWLGDRKADLAEAATEAENQRRRFYGQVASGLKESVGPVVSRMTMPSVKTPVAPVKQGAHRQIQGALRNAADSAPARMVAGYGARLGGNVVGLASGALQTAEDIKDSAVLIARLMDPTESWRRPRGETAWDEVDSAAGALFDKGKRAVADSRTAIRDAAEQGRRMRRDLDPGAAPAAPTLPAEIRRNFAVGRNQGEFVAEGAGWLLGAGELKALSKIGAMSKAERIAKHLDQGFFPAKATHLSEPYFGKGHHSILPERARFPDALGGGPYPRWVLDSAFNKLHPNGISRGDFYELHSQVDDHFYGAGFPRNMGGPGWSATKLGIKPFGLPGRLYHGTPGPTKAVIGGAAVVGGGYLNEAVRGEGKP